MEVPMSDKVALFASGLTKSYGRVRALRGIDLEIQRGEVLGYLGPNGAGKTTTIRCLLDLIRPDGGTLRVFGMDPQKQSVEVRARTGYLPGELQIDPNRTARGALRYFNALRGNSVDWNYVNELAERLQLDLRATIKNLSHGNKQKIGVVQALMHRPDLLLMDEPTLGLDPLMQREVLRLICDAKDAGTSVFFSSHIMSEVEAVADRVAIIRKGVVVEVAEPTSLINRAFRRASVRFKQSVDVEQLDKVPGVTVLSRNDGTSVLLQVEGEMENLLKALAALPVIDLETERPSLEEIFLAYYEDEGQES
jgi:ABC-2 type transport system ATP-binding protein